MVASLKSTKLRWYWLGGVYALLLCACLLLLGYAQASTIKGVARSSGSSSNLHSTLCDPSWHTVVSPNPGVEEDVLNSVSAISANDVWVVGAYRDSSGIRYPLIEHWNGSFWTVVPGAFIPGGNNELYSIYANTSNDIWAIGVFSQAGGGAARTLTEHWNGSQWSLIASPNLGEGANILSGVAAIDANDVWAVGSYLSGNTTLPLTEHWNGIAWRIITNPTPQPFLNYLRGVSGSASSDVWTVGNSITQNSGPDLIEHWNGTNWSIVPDPDPSLLLELYGVAAISANDAWGVGGNGSNTFTKHWNGTSWTTIPSANVAGYANILSSVAAVSPSDVWAVGSFANDYDNYELTEHWDGTIWSIVPTDNSVSDAYLSGVSSLSSTDVWAVGTTAGLALQSTVIEHYTSECIDTPTPNPMATQTNTPLPTQTPGGPTATPEPSSTPTATSTSCSLQFTDVPQESTFYPYIRCLACRGIVSGYTSDPPCTTGIPCFRPGASVTRGQMAKFIANAVGYRDPIPLNQQTFTDVPNSNIFWLYVERAYLHGVIAGYATSSQCMLGTPCFLPANGVTRGQTAKFVSNAAGYNDVIPSSRQTFTDVPRSSPFWVFVERTYLHAVIAGYTSNPPCTVSEPCFLPGNGVTRGQTAKFISNAFFTDCHTPSS